MKNHKAKELMKLLKLEWRLFIQSPKRYLYIFTFPKNKYITISNFDPKLKIKGEEIVARLAKEFPFAKVHFFGSVALELPGQGDLDLMMECSKYNFYNYSMKLEKIYGIPVFSKPDFLQWEFEEDGYQGELALATPDSRLFKMYSHVFDVLNQKEVKAAYKKLKLESNGISKRAYEKKRLRFFNDLGLND